MKKRSCVRMDDLNPDQRKELDSRIEKTVTDYSKEIQKNQNPGGPGRMSPSFFDNFPDDIPRPWIDNDEDQTDE